MEDIQDDEYIVVWDGGSIRTAGDVNGDGWQDIFVRIDSLKHVKPSGADGYWIGEPRIKGFWGGPNPDTVQDWELIYYRDPENEDHYFHPRDIICMDIDGDGYDDLLVSGYAPWFYGGAILIYRGEENMDTIADYIIKGHGIYDICNAGDINGDGWEDLAGGGWSSDVTNAGGGVWIFYGGPEFDTIPDIILNGGVGSHGPGAFWEDFGGQIAGGGDINDDGYDDLVIGAARYGLEFFPPGRIYIYFGGDPMDTIYDAVITGYRTEMLGGDFMGILRNEGDGDDVIIGRPTRESHRGIVWILYGTRRRGPKVFPFDTVPEMVIRGPTDVLGFGYWGGSRVGFVSGDRCEDFIIRTDDPANYYFYYGREDTVADGWVAPEGKKDSIRRLGFVHPVGDFNKDGKDDFSVNTLPYYGIYPLISKMYICGVANVGVEEDSFPFFEVRFVKDRMIFNLESGREVIIFDCNGRIVRRLYGRKIEWDLRDENNRRLSKGVYFYISGKKRGKLVVK